MSPPNTVEPAPVESKERIAAFVPVQPDHTTYLQLMKERFGGENYIKRVGACPYDDFVSAVKGKIGAEVYDFIDVTDYGVGHIKIEVQHENGNEPNFLARLTLDLPWDAPEKGESRVTVAVPHVTIHEQNCSDSVLKTILSNIAPAGLETRIIQASSLSS